MARPSTADDLTDQERRWMVHIFAALTNHIEDELEYDTIPHHIPHLKADNPDRFRQLWQYVETELLACMKRAHPEETTRVYA